MLLSCRLVKNYFDFTSDLGELINRQSKDESVKVRQDAIERAVADAWEAAQEIKVKAVKDAVEKAQVQHEKQLRRVARQHDRALKVRDHCLDLNVYFTIAIFISLHQVF